MHETTQLLSKVTRFQKRLKYFQSVVLETDLGFANGITGFRYFPISEFVRSL